MLSVFKGAHICFRFTAVCVCAFIDKMMWNTIPRRRTASCYVTERGQAFPARRHCSFRGIHSSSAAQKFKGRHILRPLHFPLFLLAFYSVLTIFTVVFNSFIMAAAQRKRPNDKPTLPTLSFFSPPKSNFSSHFLATRPAQSKKKKSREEKSIFYWAVRCSPSAFHCNTYKSLFNGSQNSCREMPLHLPRSEAGGEQGGAHKTETNYTRNAQSSK